MLKRNTTTLTTPQTQNQNPQSAVSLLALADLTWDLKMQVFTPVGKWKLTPFAERFYQTVFPTLSSLTMSKPACPKLGTCQMAEPLMSSSVVFPVKMSQSQGSVVDRQIACIGASAFAKAWKRTKGKQAILLTCHYDVLDWLEPDWVYNTDMGEFSVNRGFLRQRKWQRPPIAFDIYQTNWRFWELFEPHHYLKMPKMIASTNYVAVVNGELVAHLAVSTRPALVEARACRLVVMPEWQGAGIGMRFLNAVCQMWLEGNNRYNKPMRTIFHTSHPNLAQALRRDKKWTQINANLYGRNSSRGKTLGSYGGHFRAVQGFRYLGEDFDDELN